MKPRIDRPASDTFTRLPTAAQPHRPSRMSFEALAEGIKSDGWPLPYVLTGAPSSTLQDKAPPEALAHVRSLAAHQQWELGRAASRAGVPFQEEMPSDWRNGWWASDMLPHRPQRGQVETCGLWEAVQCTHADEPEPHPDTIRVSPAIGLSPEEMAARMSPPVSLRVVADTGALDTLRGVIEANDRMASALREIRDACAATTTRAYTTLSTIDGIARRGLL